MLNIPLFILCSSYRISCNDKEVQFFIQRVETVNYIHEESLTLFLENFIHKLIKE